MACVALMTLGRAWAKDTPIDQARVVAARAVAERWWVESELAHLPPSYDLKRFERAIQGDVDADNIVSIIAVATLRANPGHEDAALEYLNGALLPFALSHQAQYVCLVAELFYNDKASTEELKALAAPGPGADATQMEFLDFAYFLIKTEPARLHLGLKMPDKYDIPEVVAQFKQTLRPNDGSMVAETAVKLGCDSQPAS